MGLIRARRALLSTSLASVLFSCGTFGHKDASPIPGEPLPVKKVNEEIVVAAWAEPAHLAKGGGQTQLLVRVQRRGGARFPGVEVSLAASAGTLYSGGRILVTDGEGMTRDRLTTTQTTTITLNAGGTRYRFRVPVAAGAP
jgi:hypothetical protein